MSAQYPTAAGTDANLFVAVNNLSTSLSDNPLSSGATTVNVASTTGFPTAGYITIEAEAISYTGTTGTSFTGCTRGADGTTAASHVTATTVFHDVVAAHHNVLKDEIKAIETDLVASYTGGSTTIATTFAKYLKLIGGTMSGAIAMGTNKITGLAAATANGDATRFEQVLLLIGGTMAGAIAMGTNKITGMGSGTAAKDAVTFDQIFTGFQPQVQGTSSTEFTTTSATFQSTNLTATISPTSASHRIKITVSAQLTNSNTNATNIYWTIFRGSTDLGAAANAGFGRSSNATTMSLMMPLGLTFIDSPATTGSTVYTVKIRSDDGTTVVSLGKAGTQVMILEEIV